MPPPSRTDLRTGGAQTGSRLRVCYFGTYSLGAGYPVNRILIDGLRRAGVDVWECRARLWEEPGGVGTSKWTAPRRGWRQIRLIGRWLAAWVALIWRWMTGPPTDVVIVGYLGQIDVLLARLLARGRYPVILNALFSLYDTVVNDRRLIAPGSTLASVIRGIDRLACRSADLIFLDTDAHIRYFSAEFALSADRFHRVFVGSDREPPPARTRPFDSPCRALFFGTYIPLHGVGTMIAAAERLRTADPPIEWTLIGRGQEFEASAATVERLGLRRVKLVGRWMDDKELTDYLAAADVCLGIFGATAKAQRVIPSKVFDALAAGKALVTADTPAARELLTHGVDAWLCPPADPDALAESLRILARDPALRAELARGARKTFETRCSPDVIGHDARSAIERLIAASS